jgi:aminoglycoside phosphotransferase (APT) family kinase protein
LKGCRFDSARAAAVFATLAPRLEHRYFTAVLAVRGAAALVEWADGAPLAAERCDPALMDEMGSVHARLHTLPPPPGGLAEGAPDWPRRLAGYLAALVARGAIDGATRDRAAALAGSATPDAFPTRIVHKDFCRENMVVSSAGAVRVVDNETLAVDCPDYDLARTWYRWPMAAPQAEAYLDAYRRRRGTETQERHFPFWAVAVLAESALFRLERDLAAAALPLARLRDLLDRPESPGAQPAFVGPE